MQHNRSTIVKNEIPPLYILNSGLQGRKYSKTGKTTPLLHAQIVNTRYPSRHSSRKAKFPRICAAQTAAESSKQPPSTGRAFILTLEGYKICDVGDIAANTMWLWAGAIGVSAYSGVISPSYNVYRQKAENFVPGYLDCLLRAPMLVQEYASRSTGIRASRLRLYPKDFLDIMFPVPPFGEQQEIMRVLSDKFAAVDKLIAIKESKIEKLEQYKKSLIYEYVTGKREVM